jgi:hypothetical protein
MVWWWWWLWLARLLLQAACEGWLVLLTLSYSLPPMCYVHQTGNFSSIQKNMVYHITGEWVKHANYGWQIK